MPTPKKTSTPTSKQVVTMQMVAEKAGLCRSSVSYALRNHPSIPLKTCKRVQKIAKEIGYRPNAYVSTLMAQLHRKRLSTEQATIGWVVHESIIRTIVKSEFFTQVIAGAQQRADELGYKIETFVWGGSGMTLQRLSNILKTRKIIGLIFAPVPHEYDVTKFPFDCFACSTIGYTLKKPELHRISIDYQHGISLIWDKIKKFGYKRPGLAIDKVFDERTRHHCLGAFLMWQTIDSEVESIPPCFIEDYKMYSQNIRKWLIRYEPDAIISNSPSDFIQILSDLKLKTTPAIFVMNQNSRTPNLNGVRQPDKEVGAAAVDTVVDQIHRSEQGIPDFPKITLMQYRWFQQKNPGEK